jgi:hypothetical protein
MLDLDNVSFTFPCPECRFTNPVTFRQVRLAMRTICRGCKKNLYLVIATPPSGKVEGA